MSPTSSIESGSRPFSTALQLRTARNLGQFDESKRIFLNDGKLWKTGDLWRQPDLAATFERLKKNGPREFYEGETAQRIADAMAKNQQTKFFLWPAPQYPCS